MKTRPSRDGLSASRVVLPAGTWSTVFAFLCARFPNVDADVWAERMRSGFVLDEAHQALPLQAPYRTGAAIHYFRALPNEVPIPFDADILYRDDHLLVVDKPHFLPVTPVGQYARESLLVRLKHATGIDTLTPMHRIDRETAGLVMFTLNPHERGAYQNLFATRRVAKTYEAIARHAPDRRWPLLYRCRLQESANFMQMAVVEGEPNADTEIALVEVDGGGQWARYRLHPVTGRKHQLRAQMCALGLPIRNDRIYPIHQPGAPDDFSHPLQLLAQGLAFDDPITGAGRRFESRRNLHWSV